MTQGEFEEERPGALNLFSIARVDPLTKPLKFTRCPEVRFVLGESCCGQKKDGPQTAPALVVTDSFEAQLAKMNWTTSHQHVPQVFAPSPPPRGGNADHVHQPFCVGSTCDAIAKAVLKAHHDGAFPVLIGGDHCLAMGSARATASRFNGEMCVVWFDAHADINTPETSPSGNMHGMPVAALIGLDAMQTIPGFEDGRFKGIDHRRIGYIGLRDVDEGEEEVMKRLKMTGATTMRDLNELGMAAVVQRVLDAINPNRDLPIHLSFDVDGMDPIDAPSTGTPVGSGVRLHEAIEMVRILRATGLLVSMDVVEINPSIGTEHDIATTVANARLIIMHALGQAVPGLKSTQQSAQQQHASL